MPATPYISACNSFSCSRILSCSAAPSTPPRPSPSTKASSVSAIRSCSSRTCVCVRICVCVCVCERERERDSQRGRETERDSTIHPNRRHTCEVSNLTLSRRAASAVTGTVRVCLRALTSLSDGGFLRSSSRSRRRDARCSCPAAGQSRGATASPAPPGRIIGAAELSCACALPACAGGCEAEVGLAAGARLEFAMRRLWTSLRCA